MPTANYSFVDPALIGWIVGEPTENIVSGCARILFTCNGIWQLTTSRTIALDLVIGCAEITLLLCQYQGCAIVLLWERKPSANAGYVFVLNTRGPCTKLVSVSTRSTQGLRRTYIFLLSL